MRDRESFWQRVAEPFVDIAFQWLIEIFFEGIGLVGHCIAHCLAAILDGI